MAPYKGYTDIGLLEKESIADVVHMFPKAQKRKRKKHNSAYVKHYIIFFFYYLSDLSDSLMALKLRMF